MTLLVTIRQLLTLPRIDRCLLATFYRQLLAILPCYPTGPQCILIDLGIRIEEDVMANNLGAFQEHLLTTIGVLESRSQTQGPPSDIMACNLEILKLRVSECLGICL